MLSGTSHVQLYVKVISREEKGGNKKMMMGTFRGKGSHRGHEDMKGSWHLGRGKNLILIKSKKMRNMNLKAL
jgi:hypothetical protein